MTVHRLGALLAVSGAACAASAQGPALEIRFSNGVNVITVAPGAAVPVSIYATGMPDVGAPIYWPNPPGGPSLWGRFAGFLNVSMDLNAASPSALAWSNLTIPGGMGYMGPPFGNAGVVAGNGVVGINIGVGWNPPVTLHEFLLWQGTGTVGASDVTLSTEFRPVGAPPQTGIEVALSVHYPPLIVSRLIPATGGVGQVFVVPGPGGMVLLGLAGLVGARRRRWGMEGR